MGAAVPSVFHYLSGASLFPYRDDLDPHRHRSLAVLAPHMFGGVYLLRDTAMLDWNFSDELTHRLPPEQFCARTICDAYEEPRRKSRGEVFRPAQTNKINSRRLRKDFSIHSECNERLSRAPVQLSR